ncbi:MAG: PEP-CTERM sorting domain-containing protein [Pontiellaceae bacterium]|nr:PEP-CTERM sorting domain-containing protein [Pontiellaceae bacterium]MBN2785992.1 PEP-CTERM sorting domain-containing protein [Pontiellaceae bacterium]
MKKTTWIAAVVALAGVANAGLFTVPNGDFEAGDDGNWTSDGGEWDVGGYTATYEATGGSGDNGGYGQIESWGANWSIFVNPTTAGTAGGGVPVAAIGVVAGTDNTFTIDLKNFAGTSPGGMKVEAWAGNVLIGNSGDVRAAAPSADWQTFEFSWAVPSGTEKMIFVPLWGADSTVGFDNVGVNSVIPEPATMGLISVFGLGLVFFRRRLRN